MNENIYLDFSLFDGFPDMCFLINELGDIKFMNKVSTEKLDSRNSKTDMFLSLIHI